MKVKRVTLIICTEDHGGYESGFCAICGARGWLSELKHKKNCPVALDDKFLNVTRLVDVDDFSRLSELIEQTIELNLLDDRREYDVEDLMSAYDIDHDMAESLAMLIAVECWRP